MTQREAFKYHWHLVRNGTESKYFSTIENYWLTRISKSLEIEKCHMSFSVVYDWHKIKISIGGSHYVLNFQKDYFNTRSGSVICVLTINDTKNIRGNPTRCLNFLKKLVKEDKFHLAVTDNNIHHTSIL